MEQQELFSKVRMTELDFLDKEELIRRNSIMEDELVRLARENYSLRSIDLTHQQVSLMVMAQLEELMKKMFGPSSEKSKRGKSADPKGKDASAGNGGNGTGEASNGENDPRPKPRVLKPSERYPNLPIVVKINAQDPPPGCCTCPKCMTPSGMTEDSEQLTVTPKKYEILLTKNVIYECKDCHGTLQTTPSIDRIKPGSSYSDEMIMDVTLSKYLDLIPIHRQAAMAQRSAQIEIPANSLIECTHHMAEFLNPVYLMIKEKVSASKVLAADETPHRMLEGDEKKSWYLWGFSTKTICFFECHSTRSGDVASDVLLNSSCEFLLSDVYSGYGKAVREVNIERLKKNLNPIVNAHCNVHARRNFFKAFNNGQGNVEAEFFIKQYQNIYQLEALCDGKTLDEIKTIRSEMEPSFKAMRIAAAESAHSYSEKSKYYQALNYFLENYVALTLCLKHPQIPLDNNSQERLFRPYVVGRKTWYGTHSKKGAQTAAVLHSIVESCKLNKINPRKYFYKIKIDILAGKPVYTPDEYVNFLDPTNTT